MASIADMINAISTGSFTFNKPEILLLIIPAIIILMLILPKSFVAIDKRRLNNPRFIKYRRGYRILLFITRSIIFALLLLALADPFGQVEKEIPGDLTLTLLIDNSTSMELFDTSFVPTLRAELEKRIPVKVSHISTPLESDIGDGMLNNLEKNKNILLISDGQATSGTNLLDVLLFAASLNSSVSATSLSPIHDDISVSIKGPSKTIAEVENFYKVKINRVMLEGTPTQSVRLLVGVDDEIVVDETTTKEEYFFSYNFSDGYHRIVARAVPTSAEHDYFPNNNVFYKTTHVIPKPKVLFVTESTSALKQVLDELYEVTQVMDLPTKKKDLEDYYAVVLNDLPKTRLKDIEELSDFVIEGNGLFVVGGYNSFDNGGYKGTAFESILPVQVGTGDIKKGDSNIVIVIDISGSFTEKGVTTTALSTSKALAYDVIGKINEKNSVGVVAFDQWPYMVADLEPLYVSKAQTLDKIERLQGQGGQTEFAAGLKGAFNLLRGKTGSKNIIFISDGFTWNDLLRQEALDVAKAMKGYGIKLYTIGTGRNLDEKFLRQLTTTGGGIYFTADTSNRLKILFGEAQKKEVGTAFSLFVIDPYHFITEDLEVDAVLYGYNQVVPKANGHLLATSDSGEPAVVVWRHGIGRVATLTVFSSGNNLGELLDRKNSKIITRIVNWAIGDPERKNDFFVDIQDARVNKSAEIVVRTKKFPKVQGLQFSKIDKNTYRAYYVNEDTGFKSVLGAVYGVNYDKEYQNLGFSEELETLVAATNGKVFDPAMVDEIVEHVKSVSRRVIRERTSFRNIFIIAALVLLVLEIVYRRVRETWFRQHL
ncbi:VWA domain-containing protein [Candidatus Woesearchaeota archaeon]|nr:VWA domain-containing protein [Candidatus Woesearchaeota archaeon]